MKKHVFVSMLLVLTLLAGQLLFPEAKAGTQYDPCEVGDHIYELEGADYSGYGAHRHFNVSSCEYASYTHQHYFITGQIVYTYVCVYCGHTKEVAVKFDDHDAGETCTLHDFGK